MASLGEVDADIAAAEAELILVRLEVDRQTTLVQRQAAAQAVLDQATALAGKSEAELLRAQSSRARSSSISIIPRSAPRSPAASAGLRPRSATM